MKKNSIMNGAMAMTAGILCMGSCTTNTQGEENAAKTNDNGGKAVVCYFSATGTTERAAKRIARAIGADIFEITPEKKYTDADLDWRNSKSRSSIEMHDRSSRPAISGKLEDADKYEVVFIGYPNWWNSAPTIINTFIESTPLEGKTIVPFMTSGGSDIVNSEKELTRSYPNLKFEKGLLINGVSDEDIEKWAKGF